MRKLISAKMAAHGLYIVLTIAGSTFVASPVLAQICEVKESGRVSSVTFLPGKKIALSGHAHGLTGGSYESGETCG